MPNLDDLNPQPLSAEDAFLDLLTNTLENLERPARGQFLQRFFRSIAHVELSETQSLDFWEQALARRRELTENLGRRVLLQTALMDVLAAANHLRLPVLMEYEELRKLQFNAASDPLTGLYNRRFFDDFFEKEINRSSRYSHRLALVIFDLHRFKEVNDRFGHPQGDVLLQMAAATLRKSLRTSDYAFRIGGDEFALLLPQSDTEQATALSKRLRAAYAATIAPLQLNVGLALDYGLAVYPDDGERQETLIRVADERLYELKNNGTTEPPRSVSRPAPAVEQPPAAPTATPVAQSPTAPPASLPADLPAATPKPTGTERRRWERVSLANTRAYASIGEGVEHTARVIDLGYGGVALETSRPESLGDQFHAVLHVPILPPVRVNLRRVYWSQGSGQAGPARVGCSFVT
jgi:diguanylate cyclase (GGDEF)-like protein